MTLARRPPTRLLLAIALASVALLLGGCVYLRLLELKQQLGRFDQFFTLQTQDGVGLICHEPVLTTADVRWLGLAPEQTRQLGHAEQWQVRWVKQLPVGIAEPSRFDIVVDVGFVNDRLNRLTIPERYFAFMPKEFLVGVIKSLGRGRIDKSEKRIEASVTSAEIDAVRPKLPAIDKLLGRPSEEQIQGESTVLRYRYIPSTKESKAAVFDLHLTFNTATGELLRWHGRTPMGHIAFNFGGNSG